MRHVWAVMNTKMENAPRKMPPARQYTMNALLCSRSSSRSSGGGGSEGGRRGGRGQWERKWEWEWEQERQEDVGE